jgi:hypothetical protein
VSRQRYFANAVSTHRQTGLCRCTFSTCVHECEPCHGVCARALLGVSYVKRSSAPLQRLYHSDYGGELGRILQNWWSRRTPRNLRRRFIRRRLQLQLQRQSRLSRRSTLWHLLRYTLLDVDTTLPSESSHFTPSKDYNGRPVDDYDD